ncbi:histidine kinase [Leptolyngbya sp. 'hensonii']|uniref:hybrid sensor histidine kinase/response regulator n=1 Tax=Leptolyngbya sp. 'hensonii' TaxID=1922337 RepID=UPI00094F4C7B|nr:hybrid sensor histidine kinase/response regulator [Leptolyngbya sp. 'hensonii']OLP17981.1 histidine kinase [Leptolyngbya sp. 'hensonii']
MSNIWTLLIADDCAEDREIYREYLLSDPQQSYQIVEAASAEVGLSLWQKKRCDAILLDFCLPDMSGLEFLDELKHQGLEAPFPVIMLTGQGNESIAVQAMKRGAQDYLVKQHLQPDILQLSVRNVIQQSHLQHPLPKTLDGQSAIATSALRIRQTLDLKQILQTAVTEVQQILDCDRAIVYQLAPATNSAIPRQSVEPVLLHLAEAGLKSSSAPDPISQFIEFLKPYHLSGPEADALLQEQTQPAILIARNRKKTPEAYLLAPILVQGRGDTVSPLWGMLVACQGIEQRRWQSEDVALLDKLVEHLAIAIQQAEQFNQTLQIVAHEKQLNAFKSQFVAMVSREYRTRLAAILAAASTLKQHGKQLDETRHQRCLQLIEDKTRQMTQLVEDLLVLEKFEAGKEAFKPSPLEVLQLFADTIEEQRQAASDRHQELTFKIAGNTRGFWGDHKLLQLMLVNLLSNAIKYSPEGSHIDVYLQGEDSHIRFEVKDKGMGIPPEDQEHLFQLFHRGSNIGTIPGSGLGLVIVKACVELHDGEITVDSQLGKGTRVSVRLPKPSP